MGISLRIGAGRDEAVPDYEKLYHLLFNAITDAAERIAQGEPESARFLLIRAQQAAEEAYLLAGDK